MQYFYCNGTFSPVPLSLRILIRREKKIVEWSVRRHTFEKGPAQHEEELDSIGSFYSDATTNSGHRKRSESRGGTHTHSNRDPLGRNNCQAKRRYSHRRKQENKNKNEEKRGPAAQQEMTETGNLSIFQVGLIYIEKKLSYCKYTRWIWKESGFENKERKEILDFKILLFCCLFVVHQRGV